MRRPFARIRARSASQRSGSSGADPPGVELQLAARRARLGERRVRALVRRQLARGGERVEVDLLGDPLGEGARAAGASNGDRIWKKTSCRPIDPEAHRTPAEVRRPGRGDRIEVEIDHPIELPDRGAHRARQLLEVERDLAIRPARRVARQVDRAEVADRRLLLRGHLEDLGAEVREVHGPAGERGLVAGPVRLVLERHPAVAGLRERPHHPARRGRAP